MQGVYRIKCKKNGKIYIGSSMDIANRWDVHKYRLKAGLHGNKYLQDDWSRLGSDVFEFKILLPLPDTNAQTVIEKEQEYLNDVVRWGKDYNIRKLATSNINSDYKPATISLVGKPGEFDNDDERISSEDYKEYRCIRCQKLLFRAYLVARTAVQVKCPRCKTFLTVWEKEAITKMYDKELMV